MSPIARQETPEQSSAIGGIVGGPSPHETQEPSGSSVVLFEVGEQNPDNGPPVIGPPNRHILEKLES
jgi:hypothetical protein